MRKFLTILGLLCVINLLSAQNPVTVHQNGHDFQVNAMRSVTDYPANNIQFWVGSGSNSIVAVFQWCQDETMGIAYGYRWDGAATVYDMLTAIDAADGRFSITFAGTTSINTYTYQDDLYDEYLEDAGWLMYTINGNYCSGLSDALVNNGYFEMTEYGDCTLPTTNIVPATDPNSDPTDVTIALSQIEYWVGTGSTEVIFSTNWCDPETALAWGVRFNGTSATVEAVMDTIAAYDPRFSYSGGGGLIYDVNYQDDTYDLSLLQPSTGYIMYNVNGVLANFGYPDMDVYQGDLIKVGNSACATQTGDPADWSTWGYAWQTPIVPVAAPATPVDPVTLCTTVHALPYSDDFAGYTSDATMRPHYAGAPLPECWTVFGNGTVNHSGNGTSTASDYFGGVGYSTSTNSYGAIAANDAYFTFIASQIYTGTNANHINDMLTTGTRRYAVLPPFDAPLAQTILAFDHRTNMADANAHLAVGYIMNDTADFVALETYAADNKVLHHDTIRFSEYANVPADARLTLMWDVASTTASTTGPGNRYCGIDNLSVILANVDTTVTPVDTTVTPVDTTQTLSDAAIDPADILYWIGTGSDSAVFVLNIDTTSVAWGYRFDAADEPTVGDMLVDIDAADPRLAYTISWETYEYTFFYVNHPLKLMTDNFRFKVDGILADEYEDFEDYDLYDGTVVVVSNHTADTWDTPIEPATVATMPVNTTISAEEILYWVGEGSNEAVIAINWGMPDTALAWGLRFDGSMTVTTALQALVAADDRLTTDAAMSTFNYTDGATALSFQNMTGNYMQFILNGNPQAGLTSPVNDGAFLKVGESAFGIGYDSTAFAGQWYPMGVAWPTPIHPVAAPDTTPVTPVPEEATIAFSDILFWIGEGSNEAVMAVNWADTALAWGYRWNGDATVADMMAHIAAADPRFSFTGTGMVSDINYIDTAAGMTTPLGITPGYYWSSTNNGVMDWGMGQTLANGDFEKWADGSTGILVDSVWVDEYGGYWNYIYVYPMTIYPVTVPDTTGGSGPDTIPEHGPFCGAVGTDGCNAIAADDNQFVAWATNVVLTRGPQNISNPNSPLASFGDETNAIGPATPNNSMEAVSLGDGGSALVTFERPIRNGEGPDFAVFENDVSGGFLELAFVEVSSDGIHFVRFPATSLTQTETQTGSFAFTDPTFINNLAGKFKIGYGTPFDLEELADSANLNIDSIVYVRIIDVVGNIDPQYATYDAFGHIVNDPWPTDFASCGFDLTGVGVIHQKPVGIESHEMPQVFAYPNPTTGTLYIINENADRIELYNMNGKLLEVVETGDTQVTLNMQSYPAGLYMLKVGNGVQKILKK